MKRSRLSAWGVLAAALAPGVFCHGQAPPLEPKAPADIVLTAEPLRDTFRGDEPVLLRIKIENTGQKAVEVEAPVDLTTGLDIVDPKGDRMPRIGTPVAGTSRRLLEPGEFFGRVIDLGKAIQLSGEGGNYQVKWEILGFSSATTTFRLQKEYRAILKVKHGDFLGNLVIELYPDSAPKTVDNFVNLAKRGFYNGLTFHRIIPRFMMQGGDPQGTGMGGSEQTIPLEVDKNRKHIQGTVAMARRADPNSASSQFYICFKEAENLDGSYAIFGQVVEGFETLSRIEQVKTDHHTVGGRCTYDHADRPVEKVEMIQILIEEVRSHSEQGSGLGVTPTGSKDKHEDR